MRSYKEILIIFYFINSISMNSQELSNRIKNDMVNFLIKEKQYTNDDLGILLKDINDRKGVVFWQKEKVLECNMDIKFFYFGSSSSNSKKYIALIKNNKETVFIGADLKQEADMNLLFNFIRFFDDRDIICFYKKVFPSIVDTYKDNLSLNHNELIFFK